MRANKELELFALFVPVASIAREAPEAWTEAILNFKRGVHSEAMGR
jgi:hypothetical protein